jgi:hypothetical protein
VTLRTYRWAGAEVVANGRTRVTAGDRRATSGMSHERPAPDDGPCAVQTGPVGLLAHAGEWA